MPGRQSQYRRPRRVLEAAGLALRCTLFFLFVGLAALAPFALPRLIEEWKRRRRADPGEVARPDLPAELSAFEASVGTEIVERGREPPLTDKAP